MRHSLAYLRSVLAYDPETGRFTWLGHQWKGRAAGTIDDRGYVRIAVQKVGYKAHRLAWMFHFDELLPRSAHIDHINGDPTDNRISNLRVCDAKRNQENSRRPRSSTTGFKGVTRCGQRFRAYICHDRRQIHLGMFSTPEAAHAAYLKAAKDLGWAVHRPN